MRIACLVIMVSLGVALGACEPSSARVSARPRASAPVDSILPREESLRRFRANLRPVTRLEGAQPSLDSLMATYLRALAVRDSAALARQAIGLEEFAWLYYPTAPQGLPPYDLAPGLLWFLLSSRSERGVRRALDVYGGQKLRLLGYDCGTSGNREGENTIWGPCTIRLRDERGDTASQRLLSQIIERDGRYKVLSYSNKL